jgi:outer membrane protein TolC
MLVASRDSARAADAAMYAARTQYVPVVRVGASYTVARVTSVFSTLRPGWAFDVGTVFPIFNGFVREDEVERAAAARTVAHVSARDAERGARAQAQALLGTVHLAAQQIRLAQVSVASARENYRVEQSRYSVGVATVLDLAIAAQNVAAAEQSLVNAHYDYQLALANLDTLVGREL